MLRQTLAALAEAHNENIIHRDLKPENIILEPVRSGGDFVKVVDFGLAKMRAETQQPGITSPGIVCGTPEYMSPEQARGDPLDARSDLYAVGVILYQLLTGGCPFEADSPTQVVLVHLTAAAAGPARGRARADDPAVARRRDPQGARAKDPADRFHDADAFSAEPSRAAIAESRTARACAAAVPPRRRAVRSCGALNPASQKFCGECGRATTVDAPDDGAAAQLRRGPRAGADERERPRGAPDRGASVRARASVHRAARTTSPGSKRVAARPAR